MSLAHFDGLTSYGVVYCLSVSIEKSRQYINNPNILPSWAYWLNPTLLSTLIRIIDVKAQTNESLWLIIELQSCIPIWITY